MKEALKRLRQKVLTSVNTIKLQKLSGRCIRCSRNTRHRISHNDLLNGSSGSLSSVEKKYGSLQSSERLWREFLIERPNSSTAKVQLFVCAGSCEKDMIAEWGNYVRKSPGYIKKMKEAALRQQKREEEERVRQQKGAQRKIEDDIKSAEEARKNEIVRQRKMQEKAEAKRNAHLQKILEQCKKDSMHDDFILDLKRYLVNVSEEFEYRDILHSVWVPLEKPKSNNSYSIWQSWVLSKTDFSQGPKSAKSSIKKLLETTVRPMQKEMPELIKTPSSIADFQRFVNIWEQYEGIGIEAVIRIYKGESGDFVLADMDAFQE
jgi:hypothetical protein